MRPIFMGLTITSQAVRVLVSQACYSSRVCTWMIWVEAVGLGNNKVSPLVYLLVKHCSPLA